MRPSARRKPPENRRLLVAAFEREEDLLGAVREARSTTGGGHEVLEVYAPYPVHGLPEAQGLAPSRLPWICFLGGLVGLSIGVALQVWTSAFSWRLNVGGKPFSSMPAFVPIAFELTILIAGLGVVAALFHACRLHPLKKAAPIVPGALDDRLVLVLGAVDAAYDSESLARRLRERHGAVLVEERLTSERKWRRRRRAEEAA